MSVRQGDRPVLQCSSSIDSHYPRVRWERERVGTVSGCIVMMHGLAPLPWEMDRLGVPGQMLLNTNIH